MEGRREFRTSTLPFTPEEMERAWLVHKNSWLARATESRTQQAAYSLLDQLATYAESAEFSMLPIIEEGFGLTAEGAAELLAEWELNRQSQ